jgi:glycosyltransferase involved in cell wall biosynthesis
MTSTDSHLPRLSIVIPSYNQARYLERSLRSVLDQGYPNLELIVIDGSSTDGSAEILERYHERIAYCVSERDAGQSDALNKGFARASGEIFGWQNADDVYMPESFHAAVHLFQQQPALQVAYSHYYEIDEDDRVTQIYYALPPVSPTFSYATCDIATQAMFWRRAAHERFGGFDIAYERCMDSCLKLHFLTRYTPPSIARVAAFWGAFRRHAAQKTNARGLDRRNLDEETRLTEHFGFQAPDSVRVRLDRIRYRTWQMGNALSRGGVRYTVKRLVTGIKRRGALW